MSMSKNVTVFQLCIDVASAFASLARRITLPDDEDSEESWRIHIFKSGSGADEVEAIINLACSALTWDAAGATPHDVAMLHEAHHMSWFSVEGLQHVTRFICGCAAGTPLADVLFIVECLASCVALNVTSMMPGSFILSMLLVLMIIAVELAIPDQELLKPPRQ